MDGNLAMANSTVWQTEKENDDCHDALTDSIDIIAFDDHLNILDNGKKCVRN